MKNMGMRAVVSILALTISGLATSSQAQQNRPLDQQTGVAFKFQTVSVPGAAETDAYAINNKNEIAGDYINAAGEEVGLLLKGSKVTSVSCPSGEATVISGLNSNGIGVASCGGGGALGPKNSDVIVEVDNGHLVFVPINCDCGPNPYGVNQGLGTVGDYLGQNEVVLGFVANLNTGAFTSLSVPGTSATSAAGINDSGMITLQAVDSASGLVSSYLYNGNSYTQINVPASLGAVQSFARGINNNGDIVYTFVDANQNAHGALYLASTGMFYPFDDPSGRGTTSAYGINDEVVGKTNSKLKIVGEYVSPASGQNFAYEATVTIKP